MSTSLHTTRDDTVSVDDVIDLNQDCLSDGRSSSMSAKGFRISLHSIDDDELRIFHRNLVTPAPSVCYSDDDNSILHQHMVRRRFVPPSRVQRPPSRGESVMLFKKINDGDEDVTSFDLVSSELRDFMDTDFMTEGVLSRPASRATIAEQTSNIQEINKFRTTALIEKKKQQKQQDNYDIKFPLMTSSRKKSVDIIATSTKPRLNSYKSQEPSSRSMPLVPELPAPKINRYTRKEHLNQSIPAGTRDEYLYKHIPKRLITATSSNGRPKPRTLPERDNANPQCTAQVRGRRYAMVEAQGNMPVETHSGNSADRSYGRKQPSDPEAKLYYQQQATPRTTRKSGVSIPGSTNHQQYISVYSTNRQRNRSDTTTTTSSSSDEEPVEENGNLSTWRDHTILTKTSQDFVLPQHHRASFSNTFETSTVYASRMQHHMNNSNDTDIEINYKSLSSPRLRTMSSHRTFPIRNYHSTATTTTVTEDEAVTDSAKQVLACIRERRKSSLMLAADHCPKLTGSTRLINNSASSGQQEVIGRPRLHFNHSARNSNNRRMDFAENEYRVLNSTSRLPQRTLYR